MRISGSPRPGAATETTGAEPAAAGGRPTAAVARAPRGVANASLRGLAFGAGAPAREPADAEGATGRARSGCDGNSWIPIACTGAAPATTAASARMRRAASRRAGRTSGATALVRCFIGLLRCQTRSAKGSGTPPCPIGPLAAARDLPMSTVCAERPRGPGDGRAVAGSGRRTQCRRRRDRRPKKIPRPRPGSRETTRRLSAAGPSSPCRALAPAASRTSDPAARAPRAAGVGARSRGGSSRSTRRTAIAAVRDRAR